MVMSECIPERDDTIGLGNGSARTWLTAGDLKQVLTRLPEDAVVSLELHIDRKDTPPEPLSSIATEASVQFDHLLGFNWLTISASIPECELRNAGFQVSDISQLRYDQVAMGNNSPDRCLPRD